MKTINFLTALIVVLFISLNINSNSFGNQINSECVCCGEKCTEAQCCTDGCGTAQGNTDCCSEKCTNQECKDCCTDGKCSMNKSSGNSIIKSETSVSSITTDIGDKNSSKNSTKDCCK